MIEYKKYWVYMVFVFLILLVAVCGKAPSDAFNIVDENGNIFITDRTGKKWDITHAVDNYDLQPENFRHGLGPNAIRPINNPQMISPGESGYPGDGSTESVIGIEINGDARAYSVSVLASSEVANDVVGGIPVAVNY